MEMMTQSDDFSLGKARSLLGLQFLSDFGDQITTALLALCILDITQSTGEVSFIYILNTLGFVIFTLLGGYLGDTFGRRNILFFADMGRGFAVLTLILAVQQKSIILVYATTFLLSLFGSLHVPAKSGAWADHIPTGSLERYNSLSELSLQSSLILGPLIASILIAKNWISTGFFIDAITFFLCAIIFSQIISNRKPAQKLLPKRELLKGFTIINREWMIKKYVFYDAIQMLGFGAFNATLLILTQRDFGWTKIEYSYHLTIIAVITTIGALIGAMRATATIDPDFRLNICAIFSALSLFVAIKFHAFPLTSLFVGICDALIVLTMAVARTKVQLAAKKFFPEHLSSVIAARAITLKSATLLGTGACLLFEKFISLETTLLIFTLPVALSCVPIILGYPRKKAVRS